MKSHSNRPVPRLLQSGQDVKMRHGLPYQWLRCKRTMPMVHHDLYVGAAVEACRSCGGRRVIEVGCGDGWNCPLLIEAGFEVTGTDFNSKAIGWAEQLVPDAEFFVSSLTESDTPRDMISAFDIVLAVEVIEHIDPANCPEAMRTMRRLCRDGGHLVVTVPSVNLPLNNPEHHRHFTADLLVQTIESGGHWRVRETRGCGDFRFVDRYRSLFRPLIDNRFFHLRPLESILFRHYLASKRWTDERRCLNLVAIAEAI